jgi:hypothetical protein
MRALRARAFGMLALLVAASGACGGGAHSGADASDAAAADATTEGGCGAVTGSCESEGTGFLLCAEYTYIDDSAVRAACMNINDTWATTPCERAGSVRGCREVQSMGCVTTWYGDEFAAEQACMGSGMELISPGTSN